MRSVLCYVHLKYSFGWLPLVSNWRYYSIIHILHKHSNKDIMGTYIDLDWISKLITQVTVKFQTHI